MKHKGAYVSMLSYFEVPENMEAIDPNVAALWKRFLDESDTFRNDRLKMIARCPTISFVNSGTVQSLTPRSLGSSQASWKCSDNHRS